jgi:hypothetical protein
VIRQPLVAFLPLLLTACTATAAPSYPTVDDDPPAAAACDHVTRAAEEMVTEKKELATILHSRSAATRAGMSADPEIKASGGRLAAVAERAGDMLVHEKASAAEMAPVRQELGVAQQDLLAACTDRFGPQPWAFRSGPEPAASN